LSDWFQKLYEDRESFEDLEEELAYRERQWALTHREVEDLCGLLSLPPGAMILDAFCGNGRHALCLARMGYPVAGVDTARSRIGFAHRWAREWGVKAFFAVGDARDLPLGRAFDAVVVLGGSFTHTPAWQDNVALLRELGRVLKPGGVFLIDNPNPIRFWRVRYPDASRDEEARLSHYDLPLGAGRTAGFVRYHAAKRLGGLCEEAGIGVTQILGNRLGEPYGPDSPRLILVGHAGSMAM
jgi:SAM-dependent methyltransferase